MNSPKKAARLLEPDFFKIELVCAFTVPMLTERAPAISFKVKPRRISSFCRSKTKEARAAIQRLRQCSDVIVNFRLKPALGM
jgi:hypothetical protein